jgi:hypothetical protein
MSQIPTSRGNPQFSDIAAEGALPQVGSLTREDGQTVLNLIDAQLAKLFEDRNVLITCGGTITLNGAGSLATFSAPLDIEFNSKVAGGAPVVMEIVAGGGSKTFSSDGRMLYVIVNRTAPSITVVDDAATLPAQTSANQEVFLIAKRRDGAEAKIYFRDGTVAEAGQSTSMDSSIAGGIDVETALPLIGSAANASLMSVLTTTDADLAKLYEDRNMMLTDGGIITYTGTALQFTQALKLHINSKIAGGAPVVIDLAATTRAFSADGRMLYAVIDRIGGTATVTADSATLPSVVAANLEVVLLAKRKDSPDGVSRVYFRNGSALDIGQSARLGSSGSGSGSGNGTLETLKNQFLDSPYQLLTPNIVLTDTNTKFATLTGATYDLVNKVINFSANAQTAVSTNMLDPTEFIAAGLDVGSIDLTVFWNKGTVLQAFAVPTAFTYEVSRDGGTNYFPVTMTRVGTTELFRGPLRFDTTTTTEATQQTLATQTGSVLNRDLAQSGADQQLAQSFVVTAAQTWTLKQVVLNVTKTGTPSGNLFLSIVTNSGGVPTTTVLAQTNAFTSNSLTTGANTISIPTVTLAAGTYHVVLSSDAAYKAGGSFASNKIQLQDASTLTGESTYNGTTWTAQSPARGWIYDLKGRSADLRVRFTSAGSPTYPCGLDGYGIFYNLQDTGVVGYNKKTHRFTFNSTVDNSSSFNITSFNPDPDLLECYYVQAGQVFKVPAFTLSGSTAVFPANTFNNGGVSAVVDLIFQQNTGGAFDNSDTNARLLAFNHLGSTAGADDKSVAGRGIILRRPDGTLREISINNSDNFVISTVP